MAQKNEFFGNFESPQYSHRQTVWECNVQIFMHVKLKIAPVRRKLLYRGLRRHIKVGVRAYRGGLCKILLRTVYLCVMVLCGG